MISVGERPEWHYDAACHGKTETFFPEVGNMYSSLREARQICQTCPVRKPCLDYALTLPHPWLGVYAGLSPRQRMTIRRNER
jgi:WhiB family redox-sensing transcriptional regulator